MSFWIAQGAGQLLSWSLSRGRAIDAWSRFFWGLLAGVGLWLVWLAYIVPGGTV